MNRVSKLLKLKLQNTRSPDKTNVTPLAPAESTSTLRLIDEMEIFENLVEEGVRKVRTAATAREAAITEESRQAQEIANNLKAEIAALKAILEETKESATRTEETLNDKVKDLQNELAKRSETLASQDNEIRKYKSTIDHKVNELSALELAIRNAKDEAASNAERADDFAVRYQGKIETLEAQLKQMQSIVRQKEWTVNNLEQRLGGEVRELESTIKTQQELLRRRDSEVNDLKSQLKRLTKGLGEMSSFFRKTEALTGFEAEDLNTADQNEHLGQVQEKPAAALSNARVVSPVPPAAQGTVPPEIFQRIINELARIANIIVPLASVMVRQQAQALGESLDQFPTNRLPQLVEGLAKEISEAYPELDCRERLAQSAHITLH
jgi:DNA repair exonuclease SbcCD ATPase subunit